MNTEQYTVTLLIGVPHTGKTSYVQENAEDGDIILSMDDITESVAPLFNFGYNDLFEAPIQPGQPGYTEDQYSQKYGKMVDQQIQHKIGRQPKVWEHVIPAEKACFQLFDLVVEAGQSRNVIIDMTNLSKGARSFYMTKFPNHEKKAVFFPSPSLETTIQRVAERRDRTGKNIPVQVLKRMHESIEPPTNDEGFASIQVMPVW